MSRKKNLLDYLALTLFIMCMGLALSASLEYVTRATEREYLGQGIWVLSMAGLSLLALLLGRISRKCGQKMQPLPKNIVMIVFGAVLVGVGVYLRLWVIWNIPVEPDSDFETYYRMANHLLNDTLMSAEGAVDRISRSTRTPSASRCSSCGRRLLFSARRCATRCTQTLCAV